VLLKKNVEYPKGDGPQVKQFIEFEVQVTQELLQSRHLKEVAFWY
jgi:hypothetical protein